MSNETEYMTIAEVAAYLGCSQSTVRRMWYSGDLIPPVRLSKRMHRWHRQKLRVWELSRKVAEPPKKTETEVTA